MGLGDKDGSATTGNQSIWKAISLGSLSLPAAAYLKDRVSTLLGFPTEEDEKPASQHEDITPQ